ncbi:aldo/keto reductase [Chondrinema litorale]|uniref:aldo/keto reductase n=1 Tax=Chondrinema litorale TaxID=2994555 RepID=UPI00254387F8|nr:aldo/keto reductase [Chondrinema litorale]UZR98220.1 aldo/keto reductase [Chondrinema litorale]
MKKRTLGKTGFEISEISLGTWQVGGKWGEPFDHDNADKILNSAVDKGINFIDTADVYGDRESEKAVGRLVKNRSERIYVASKCGRRLNPHTNEAYTPKALRTFVEESLQNMGIECLDLIQIHCPPTEVYYRPEIFEEFEKLKAEGKILNMGVSVEKVEEAIKAIEYDCVTTVQIIFNMFRQRPADLFFKLAKEKNVGIITRVPLASGLLSGKFSKDTTFGKEDHRNFNRDGAAFDKGETFAGIDYNTGLEAVEILKDKFPDVDLVMLALKWILMFDEVSCVIPGASKELQLIHNVVAADFQDLSQEQMSAINDVYNTYIKKQVHHLW